ncbi:FMN reductase (NADH) RutF [Paraburkholderia unamae]|uniref:flavin reductase n=1 Tax=Paraburkholderia unamae TaxID=219649 RepID=UPI001CABAE7C|nr:flavin reductase [Paraburkholderia unamae]CAG9256952.1 FMN reductase (NADH) RutF [Paraburkholderia unamae]
MIDKSFFRDAMTGLGAAVNIVTTDGEAGRAGCTASAVCGVTDEPPTLLVCINRASRNNAIMRANGHLCVNVLAAEQREVATRFATKDMALDERFASGDWYRLETGAPALRGAVSSFDCRITRATEVGTHTVFYCEIKAARMVGGRDGLIWFGRAFHRVLAQAHAAAA